MDKKTKMWVIIGFIIVVGLSYYVGLKSGSKVAVVNDQPGQNQGMNRTNRVGGMRGGISGGGFFSGSIVSIDKTSIIIATRDGSSKIILFSTVTPVTKMVAGTSSDLVVGKDVNITGTTNSDGSVSAESISLRPAQKIN